ncbi:DUF2236 domain-containing protein [Pseudooceanicola sp. CBS1P-1]|uniref:DUF2236 domain-containing protein n=1 Tax=Pseudooceanicola albus TaxID=2692189 RepID=A0A6L7FYE3_9RHOB|nr:MULTISPECIES: oxygenase MpaB family protein [Pseudooceanicola]MBT9383410.1 DUF2236 domain-containing protein [Pseudooceanicola endophyticus]MXN16268.1 DUF2236 domain-containing protein [Pseudooceanicola albus]
MSRWSAEIETLDPETDYERIYQLLSTCECAWDTEKALEFALFRTYAIPSISGLLVRTGEFRRNTRKRYDDTELLLSEISENGQDSDRGQAALGRINAMHGRYRIDNADMLYVLSTFITEPVRWMARFGRRPLSPAEITACLRYYQALGRRMGITDIPGTYAEIEAFAAAHEAAHQRYADTNAEVARQTRDLLLSFYLPKGLVPLGRPLIHALCDPGLRRAMDMPDPPRALEALVLGALRLRARVLRRLPPRRRPRRITARRRASYPRGYRIEELGTFRPPPAGRR